MSTQASMHPFETLTPEFIMDAIESCGYRCDCRTFPLNSYENRVYQVGIEDAEPLIVKFYRPERWSDAQILEEHAFCFELAEHELPVVPPLADRQGKSLFAYGAFRFALFPRQGGHAPEFDNLDNLLILGRTIGRMHAVAATKPFRQRPRLDCTTFGQTSVTLIGESFILPEYRDTYTTLSGELLQTIAALFEESEVTFIRTHGDCHPGNILWRNEAPHFVDFDDARNAPAVQDLWMMLSGERPRQTAQLAEIIEGYQEFYDFRPNELRLVEALRTLRILHYSAWLARRWKDPMFRHHFPWFNTPRYWGEHILQLREQVAALQEPALQISP